MNLPNAINKIDRVQNGRSFKIAASALVLIALLTYIGFSIVGSTTSADADIAQRVPEMLQDQNGKPDPKPDRPAR